MCWNATVGQKSVMVCVVGVSADCCPFLSLTFSHCEQHDGGHTVDSSSLSSLLLALFHLSIPTLLFHPSFPFCPFPSLPPHPFHPSSLLSFQPSSIALVHPVFIPSTCSSFLFSHLAAAILVFYCSYAVPSSLPHLI